MGNNSHQANLSTSSEILTDDILWFMMGKPCKLFMGMKQLDYLKGASFVPDWGMQWQFGPNWTAWEGPCSPCLRMGVRCWGSCNLGNLLDLFSKFWKVEKSGGALSLPSFLPCNSGCKRSTEPSMENGMEGPVCSQQSSTYQSNTGLRGHQGWPSQAAPLWLSNKEKCQLSRMGIFWGGIQ